MLAVFVAVIFAGTAILVVALIAQSRKEREVAKNSVLERLLASIRNRNLDISDFARYSKESGLSLQEIKEVAIRAYSRCFRYALDNPDVWHELTEIASKLRLTAGDRDDAEAPLRMERYLHAWEKIAGDTLPNFSDLQSFSKYQLKLGITDRLAARAFASRAVPLYRAAFRGSLEAPPKVNSDYLTNLRTVLGMDALAALQAVKVDAVNHVAAHCDVILSNNKATASDRDALLKLMRQLNVDTFDLSDRWQTLERTILLQSLRDGALPKLSVRIALRPGENCHYHDSCDFSWKSPRGEWRTASGDLFVSNQRLIVASNEPGKSFEMKLSNIVDVLLAADGVQIRCTASKGTGNYQVKDCELLESTIVGVLRNDTPPALRSRIVPSFVKQQVWARDRGKCVACGSTDDLHYDHDIPFSKGGSNTVENIQLLCARCNLKKRDRIE